MKIEKKVVITVLDDDGNEVKFGSQVGIKLKNGAYEVGVFDRIDRGCLVFKRPGDGKEVSHKPHTIEDIDTNVKFSIEG